MINLMMKDLIMEMETKKRIGVFERKEKRRQYLDVMWVGVNKSK